MPDEQRKRKRFEETAVQALGFETGDFDREESGEYVEYVAEAAWQMFRVRDAEMQALRERVDHAKRIFQNAEVRSGYCVCGETLARHSHLAYCPYTDQGQWESELWLKREAALAGGETGGEDE